MQLTTHAEHCVHVIVIDTTYVKGFYFLIPIVYLLLNALLESDYWYFQIRASPKNEFLKMTNYMHIWYHII